MLEGLRTDEEKVHCVVTLLAYGCPCQAIVHAFGLDERTVAVWQKRAGTHCKHVHENVVQQGKVKSQHSQADEIRAKGRNIVVWMALAMDVVKADQCGIRLVADHQPASPCRPVEMEQKRYQQGRHDVQKDPE
jgi:hypothetical protein